MRMVRVLSKRVRSLLRRGRVEAELEQELQLHIDGLTREFITEGMSEADARALARREFGPLEGAKEECRDLRGVRFLEDTIKDLRYACRQLLKSPTFALTAVVSLALGIGANTIVFSVLNTLILKPLPVAEPERIRAVNNTGQPANSFPNYRDIRDRNEVFESLYAYRIAQMGVAGNEGTERVWGYLVTGNYFQTLGVKPALGRFFTAAEDVNPGASPFAVLSYESWRNRFGGDPHIVGKGIRINKGTYTVLGVAPRGFHGTEVFYWPEIWVPMMMQAQIETYPWLNNRNTFNAWMGGRLKRGISGEQAEANLGVIAGQLAREHSANEGMKLTLSAPGLAGSMLRQPARSFGVVVMLLALLVLLAACVNLAALMSARIGDRAREIAIRVSIGAGRGRLVRQLITESLTISVIGAAAGCGIAAILLRLLSEWRAPLDFPVQFDVNPDWRVFLFASSAAAVTGMLFAIGPASRVWRASASAGLKGNVPAWASARRVWLGRDFLLPLQLALSCVLVVSSLVAVRGLTRSLETPLGFRPDGVAVLGYDLGLARYEKEKGKLLQQRALEAIAALPGIDSAALASSVPLSIDQSTTTIYRENETDFRGKNRHGTTYYVVSPGYFRTAGTTLLAGRDFTTGDSATSPYVAVVNQTLARRVTGTEDAVGRRFRWGPKGEDFVEIIGIVEDGKYETLTEAPKETAFFALAQSYSPTTLMLVRSHRPSYELAGEMRAVIERLDAQLAVYGAGSLREMLGLVYLPMNAAVITLGAFGILSLMLCLTGIYGLSAYTVSRRTKEIALRIAVGARSGQVLKYVFGRLGGLVAAGVVVGFVLAMAASGLLASIVYQADARHPVVIGGSLLSILLVALIAGFYPARRALGTDVVQTLRQE